VRGIPDEDINLFHREIIQLAEKSRGDQMLYEIIQFMKEKLDNYNNIPKLLNCSICLEDFNSTTAIKITNLDCYHYFHEKCLLIYLKSSQQEINAEKNEAALNNIRNWTERFVNLIFFFRLCIRLITLITNE
jgi:protein-arginine kinase activator protein McsA